MGTTDGCLDEQGVRFAGRSVNGAFVTYVDSLSLLYRRCRQLKFFGYFFSIYRLPAKSIC